MRGVPTPTVLEREAMSREMPVCAAVIGFRILRSDTTPVQYTRTLRQYSSTAIFHKQIVEGCWDGCVMSSYPRTRTHARGYRSAGHRQHVSQIRAGGEQSSECV